MGTQEATGLARLTQRVTGGQGGSEDPSFPFIPLCDLTGQARWPATYLGHSLRPGLGEWVQGQDSACEQNQEAGAEVGAVPGAGSAQNTDPVKRPEFQGGGAESRTGFKEPGAFSVLGMFV